MKLKISNMPKYVLETKSNTIQKLLENKSTVLELTKNNIRNQNPNGKIERDKIANNTRATIMNLHSKGYLDREIGTPDQTDVRINPDLWIIREHARTKMLDYLNELKNEIEKRKNEQRHDNNNLPDQEQPKPDNADISST